MQHTRFEQARIQQLVGTYSPEAMPKLPLDFGDFLSLLWRIDHHAEHGGQRTYYYACAAALAAGLNLPQKILLVVETAAAGEMIRTLHNVPYRGVERLVDVADRRAALIQLLRMRDDTLRIGTYQEGWSRGYPGAGIVDTELRERVFAVLYTALQGQFSHYGRLLLVLDIVLSDLLLGAGSAPECTLDMLVNEFDYPDPTDPDVRRSYHDPR